MTESCPDPDGPEMMKSGDSIVVCSYRLNVTVNAQSVKTSRFVLIYVASIQESTLKRY